MSDPNTVTIQQLVDQFLAEEKLPVSQPSLCPYLSDREDQVEWFYVDEFSPAVYEALMDRGFRRNGGILYRPLCEGCQECKQARVPAGAFKPSKSMRRVWRRNHDLSVEVRLPAPTAEQLDLFRRYLESRPDGPMTGASASRPISRRKSSRLLSVRRRRSKRATSMPFPSHFNCSGLAMCSATAVAMSSRF